MDRDEPRLQCFLGFIMGEIPLWAYHNDDFLSRICAEDVLDAAAGRSVLFEAVGNQFQSLCIFI